MCAVHFLTGVPCPGCGFLHALWFAGQGEWERAFEFFPLWPAILLFALFFRRSIWMGKVVVASVMIQWIAKII